MASPQQPRPILIIDAMNLFVRSFAAYPQMTSNGEQFGGCIGFLKTLRRLASEQQPSAIYIAWEGGGSARRRGLFSEYKMGRRPEKLNRFYGDDIPDTNENRKHQLVSLLAMLKCAPVCQIYVSDCEGDDVIAYLCRGPFKDVPKVIASSDKDMYQLLDENTKAYSLHKKTYVSSAEVLTEFRVTANNFAIAKALCGDASDNIPGVKGIGFKTLVQKFPFLGTEDTVILQDMFDYCHSHFDESVIYKRVLESQEDVKRNWKLVFLDGGMLSATQATKVDHVIDTFAPKVDKMGLIKLLIKEGINDFDTGDFFYAFNGIEGLEYKTGDNK
jgi:5'-3' exonuclease